MPKNKEFLFREFEEWYVRHQRILPWRSEPTPYRVWISEIMLQQTQVAAVVPYFERFVQRFPSIESIANSSEEEVLSYWSGLGYYSRARNIYKTAQDLCAFQQGKIPSEKSQLLKLAGIGPYTAGAILSIAFQQPEAILDGNVERVLSRLYCQPNKSELWKISADLVQSAFRRGILPSHFNQAMMELGATVCSVKNPDCGSCPLVTFCGAFDKKQIEDFPPSRKQKPLAARYFSVLILVDRQGGQTCYALRRRAETESWWAGLWEFPTIETNAKAQLPASWPRAAKKIGSFQHAVTRYKLTVTVYSATLSSPAEKNSRTILAQPNHRNIRGFLKKMTWIRAKDLPNYSVSSLLTKSIRLLEKR